MSKFKYYSNGNVKDKYYTNGDVIGWSNMYVNEFIDKDIIATKKEEVTFVDKVHLFPDAANIIKDLDVHYYVAGDPVYEIKKTYYCKGGFTVPRLFVLAQHFMMHVDETFEKYKDIGRIYEYDTGFGGFEFCEETSTVQLSTCS